MENDMTSDTDNGSHNPEVTFPNRKRRVLAVLAFVTVMAFAAISIGFRGYQSTVSVLVIPRAKSVSTTSEIVDNVVFLSQTSAFHTFFFQTTESVPGLMSLSSHDELSGTATEKLFDSMVSVSSAKRGGIISVHAFRSDPDDAKSVAHAAALSLFRYASKYYDVKEEVDFRIVDGPTVSARLPDGLTLLFGLVVLCGAVAFVISPFLSLLSRGRSLFEQRKMSLSAMPFSADMFKPKRPASTLLSGSVESGAFDRESENTDTDTDIDTDADTDIVTVVEPETEIDTTVTETDSFFEPVPPVKTAEAARTSETVPVWKKAPAPLDIPTFSEEEARFLKEFAFEPVEEESGSDHADAPIVETAPTGPSASAEIPETQADAANVPAAPTRSEYQRRLNELLRG